LITAAVRVCVCVPLYCYSYYYYYYHQHHRRRRRPSWTRKWLARKRHGRAFNNNIVRIRFWKIVTSPSCWCLDIRAQHRCHRSTTVQITQPGFGLVFSKHYDAGGQVWILMPKPRWVWDEFLFNNKILFLVTDTAFAFSGTPV